jgi:photosystem II stability/assembly factor-like uncharacterized protein
MARVAVVFASVLLVSAAPAANQPEVTRQLYSARLFSPSVGVEAIYSVTARGVSTFYEPHLFVTHDGRSWSEITPPRLLTQLGDFDFLDAAHGWVTAYDCAAGRAFVYKTVDGGRSWSFTPVPGPNCSAGSRFQVSFADASHGSLLTVDENSSRNGDLSLTRDGGRTWTPVAAQLPIKGSFVLSSPWQGWLARREFDSPQQLYATRNGEKTWRRRFLPLPKGWSGARLFPDVPTFFGDRGVLPVSLSRGNRTAVAFHGTRDAGRAWKLRSVRPVSFSLNLKDPFVRYVPTSIPSPKTWWIVQGNARPSVAVTTNAGRTWQQSSPPSPAPSRGWQISATDPQHAWLTTFRQNTGKLYATSDGGHNWHRLLLAPG